MITNPSEIDAGIYSYFIPFKNLNQAVKYLCLIWKFHLLLFRNNLTTSYANLPMAFLLISDIINDIARVSYIGLCVMYAIIKIDLGVTIHLICIQ